MPGDGPQADERTIDMSQSTESLEAAVNRAVRALVEVARQADDDALRHAAERAADAVLSAWEDAE